METDGNSITQLRETFEKIPVAKGKPTLIIANTIKGKGVSYMENVKKWHHGVPSDEQYELAMNELNAELNKLNQVMNV